MSVIIAVTGVAIARVAPNAETVSASQNNFLENKHWRGDFDGMAKEIGRETAQKVRNKYKYDIAYPMIRDQVEVKERLLKTEI